MQNVECRMQKGGGRALPAGRGATAFLVDGRGGCPANVRSGWEGFCAQVVWITVDASVSSGRSVRPDKTGHFRTLWLWEAWEGVWEAMAVESIMMVSCFLLVCQGGGTVLTDALVVGRSTLDGLGRSEGSGRGRRALLLAIHVGWPCVSVGAEPCKGLGAASNSGPPCTAIVPLLVFTRRFLTADDADLRG